MKSIVDIFLAISIVLYNVATFNHMSIPMYFYISIALMPASICSLLLLFPQFEDKYYLPLKMTLFASLMTTCLIAGNIPFFCIIGISSCVQLGLHLNK